MNFTYNSMRDTFYFGILLLVLEVVFRRIPFVWDVVSPFFEWSILGIPFMFIVAVAVAITAFYGWKYRSIG